MLSTSEMNAATIENKTDFIPISQSPEMIKYLKYLSEKFPGRTEVADQLEKNAHMNMDSKGRNKKTITIANISLFKIFIMMFPFSLA
jgi:hypothetical protein